MILSTSSFPVSTSPSSNAPGGVLKVDVLSSATKRPVLVSRMTPAKMIFWQSHRDQNVLTNVFPQKFGSVIFLKELFLNSRLDQSVYARADVITFLKWRNESSPKRRESNLRSIIATFGESVRDRGPAEIPPPTARRTEIHRHRNVVRRCATAGELLPDHAGDAERTF